MLPHDEIPIFTPKECEVVYLVCKGYTYQQIANEQGVTIDGVKRHINNIYSKLEWTDEPTELKRAYLKTVICPYIKEHVVDKEQDCEKLYTRRLAEAGQEESEEDDETTEETDPEIDAIVAKEIDELLPLEPAPLDIVRPRWHLFPPVPLWRRILPWAIIIILSVALYYVVFLQAGDVERSPVAEVVVTATPLHTPSTQNTPEEPSALGMLTGTPQPTFTPVFHTRTPEPTLTPTPTSTATPTPTPTSTPVPLPLEFTFDEGIDPLWQFENPGNWLTVRGGLTTSVEDEYVYGYVGNETWQNYSVEAVILTENPGTVRIALRHNPETNSAFYLQLNSSRGPYDGITVIRRLDGEELELLGTGRLCCNATRFRLRAIVEGNQYRFFYGESLENEIGDIVDNSLERGRIGIGIKGDPIPNHIDYLSVTEP